MLHIGLRIILDTLNDNIKRFKCIYDINSKRLVCEESNVLEVILLGVSLMNLLVHYRGLKKNLEVLYIGDIHYTGYIK